MVVIEGEIFIWLPRPIAYWKITIDGVDVTDDVDSASFTKADVEEVGSFKMSLDNNAGNYAYTGGETVRFYSDFVDATTLRFQGYIEKNNKIQDEGSDTTLELEGRHEAGKFLDILVTETYDGVAVSGILNDLISKYGTSLGFTSANVTSSATTASFAWEDTPFWSCVVDLCNRVQYSCYVDDSKDFHFFAEGSIRNEQEAVAHDDNSVEVTGLNEPITDIRNRIIVKGADDSGNLVIQMAEDATSQETYGVKEKVVEDSDIKTDNQALERAQYELNLYKAIGLEGTTVSELLPSLQPGDMIWISLPPMGIHAIYKVKKFTHYVPDENTECIVQSDKNLGQLFVNSMKKEQALEQARNPNKMRFSYNFPFSDSSNILSLSGIEISNGSLILTSSPGVMESISKNESFDIGVAEIKIVGQDTNVSIFEVSNNDGQDYEVTLPNVAHTFSSVGRALRVRVTLVSDAENIYPEIESLSLLYKA